MRVAVYKGQMFIFVPDRINKNAGIIVRFSNKE